MHPRPDVDRYEIGNHWTGRPYCRGNVRGQRRDDRWRGHLGFGPQYTTLRVGDKDGLDPADAAMGGSKRSAGLTAALAQIDMRLERYLL